MGSFNNNSKKSGSGCGSVGRVVDSDTRGLQFESSHRQKFIHIEHLFMYCQLCIEKTKIKKKRQGWPIFRKNSKNSGKSDT